MMAQNWLALKLSLAIALCCLAMAASSDSQQRQNRQHEQRMQLQRIPAQRAVQQLIEQLQLKVRETPAGQQEFDAFDLANLRRVPQINGYYGADDAGNNKRNNKVIEERNERGYPGALAGGSVRAWYGQHEDGDDIAPNNANKYDGVPMDAAVAGDNPGNKGQHMPHATAASRLHGGDAAYDFRLQLSDSNEPVGIRRITQNHNNLYNNNRSSNNRSNGTDISGGATKPNSATDHAPYNSNANERYLHPANFATDDAYDEDLSDFVDAPPDIDTHFGEQKVAPEDDELGMALPYGIQNVRKRTVRGNPAKSTTYQSLCPTRRTSIPLETAGFEYRPNHYIEVTCAHNYAAMSFDISKNRICSEAGFSCIQLNRTIHLIRRNKAATVECWDAEIRIVPSGCECMWPKHSYGDIVAYHNAQKRNGNANVNGNSDGQAPNYDTTTGLGFRQVELVDIEGRRNAPFIGGGDGGFDAYDLN